MCLSLSVKIRLKFFSLVGGRRNGSSFPRGNTSGERMRGRRRRGKTECDIGPWRRPLKDTPCPCPSMDRMRRPWPRFTSNKVAITIGYIGVVRRLHCARDNPDGSSTPRYLRPPLLLLLLVLPPGTMRFHARHPAFHYRCLRPSLRPYHRRIARVTSGDHF